VVDGITKISDEQETAYFLNNSVPVSTDMKMDKKMDMTKVIKKG
jgi:hypothetical protein